MTIPWADWAPGALAWASVAVAIVLTVEPAPGRSHALARAGRLAAAPSGPGPRRRPGFDPVPFGVVSVVLTAGVVTVAVGPVLAVAAGAACAVGVLLVGDRRRDRAARRRHRDLVTAGTVLAGELSAGARPADALAAAGAAGPTVGPVFAEAARAASRAGDAADVLLEADLPGLRALGVAWRLVDRTGAGLAGVVDRVVADLVALDAQRRSVAVALAGPRSSAVVLSLLPAVGIALGAAMGARPWDLLLGTPTGQVLADAGVLLDLAGVLWIRRITAAGAVGIPP